MKNKGTRMSKIVLALFLLGGIEAAAQSNLDSLYAVWQDETMPDSNRVTAYKDYIWDGFLYSNPDTAFVLAEALHGYAKKHNYPMASANGFNLQGVLKWVQSNYPRALEYFDKGLAIQEELGDKRGIASSLNNIGLIYGNQGDYPRALEYYDKSLAIREELGDKMGIAISLMNIGLIYVNQGDYPRALEYYDKSLAIQDELGNKMGIANSLNNIGNIYNEQGNYPRALEYFEKSLAIQEELGDKMGIAISLSRIGTIYLDQGNYPRALEYYDKSLAIQEELGDKRGIASSLNSIGILYRKKGNTTLALNYCRRGLALGEEIKALEKQKAACECLYETYKAMGKGNEALVYLEKYLVIEDSLNTEETDKLLQQMEFDKQLLADSLEHVAELAQVESERTIEQIRADKNRNSALATGGGALLILAGGGAWFYSDRKRRKERFEKEAATLETQALRSQMNPHFIFNALNSINAFVQQNDPDNATSFLTKFAKVMRGVLENSRHSEVPLQDDLDTLRGYMDLERKRMNEQFDFTIEVAEDIDPEEVMVPPLVVQPFVENAIWHGMKGREDQGHITLRVKKEGDQLVWQIEDDGAGRHAKKDPSPEPSLGQPVKKTSLGTAITRSRLDLVQKQHGGKAGFRYEDLPRGTRVIVEMPLLLG